MPEGHSGKLFAGVLEDGDGLFSTAAPPDDDFGWKKVFDVNVFGVVNILRVFVPRLVAAGPLPSGKKTQVVTTSSVMGLFDGAMGLSPYNASKMACTSICEMVYHELQLAGEPAAHVATHTLHPSMAGTGIFGGEPTSLAMDPEKEAMMGMIANGVGDLAGGLTAADVIDGLFAAIGEGKFYCVVDDAKDVPTTEQIRLRMEGQIGGSAPATNSPMASMTALRALMEVEAPAKASL